MCNKSNYMFSMKEFIEYERLEKAAKQEKEKIKQELIEYMKQENTNKLEYNGLTATYTEYVETRFDKTLFSAKAPKTFERFFNLYHKTTQKTRFICK